MLLDTFNDYSCTLSAYDAYIFRQKGMNSIAYSKQEDTTDR